MSTPSPSNDSGHARRLIVTILIGTAAAAVTAGVALNKHPAGEAVVQRVAASPVIAGSTAVPAAMAPNRRVEWRDPWKRPAPLSESAATSIHDAAVDGAQRSDPSLPAAADALEGAIGLSSEAAPTF